MKTLTFVTACIILILLGLKAKEPHNKKATIPQVEKHVPHNNVAALQRTIDSQVHALINEREETDTKVQKLKYRVQYLKKSINDINAGFDSLVIENQRK